MNREMSRCGLVALALICLLSAQAAWSGGYTHLPRSYGPFELRMSTDAFARLTGVQPQPCPVCIDGEMFVTLDGDQVKQVIPSYNADEGMDFFFYQDKLYHFTVPPRYRDLFLAREEYQGRFGGPGQPQELEHGLAMLKWEDTGTVLTLNYRTDEEQVYAVNYYDWDLKEERDWRESMMFDQQGKTGQTS